MLDSSLNSISNVKCRETSEQSFNYSLSQSESIRQRQQNNDQNNDNKKCDQNYFGVREDREPLVMLSNILSRKSVNESDGSVISQSKSSA
jgi:hypothetical protein